MKALFIASSVALGSLMALPAHAAEQATKVTFAADSYCGNFSGNIKQGKKFKLWLQPDQELIIENTGNDQVNVAYVEGPSGRLYADKYEDYNVYVTDKKGNHYIKVYGNDNYSSVDFCAY